MKWALVCLALSLALNGWMGWTVARLENFKYAVAVGECGDYDSRDIGMRSDYLRCLNSTRTRTNRLWHIFYAMTEADD